jgi:hypothetical protein
VNNVIVIDSMMGTGKTSYAIQLMQQASAKQSFIYVTPFLKEVERIRNSVTNRNFVEPDVQHGCGTKMDSLKKLIEYGADIVTTHALFAAADDELIDLLNLNGYTLILDEVMDVVTVLSMVRKDDLEKVLLPSGLIEVTENSQVAWKDPSVDTSFNQVKQYALAGNLYAVNNTALVWSFPAKMFRAFHEVYILTYLFDAQVQKYFYDLHGIQYDCKAVVKQGDRYKLVPKSEGVEDRSHLKSLISIYDGKLNKIGETNTFSKSWFINKDNRDQVTQLKNNLYNYLRNLQKASADEILWTTFLSGDVNDQDDANAEKNAKTVMQTLKGKGFSLSEDDVTKKAKRRGTLDELTDEDFRQVCFTPCTLRATNRYKHKTVLAYCMNRFMNPIVEHFFYNNGITVNENLWALSELLQWVFRSAVRDGKPVQIYIPSKRMRTLLQQWLNG